MYIVQGVAADLGKWLSSSTVFKIIVVYLHHCLKPGTETAAGLRHGVLVEVAHHLLDLYHQGGDSSVRGFIDV